MIRVMDMSTGRIIEDEFGSFEDEVLGAGWVQPMPAHLPDVQLGLQQVATSATGETDFDADAFLSKVYRNQA